MTPPSAENGPRRSITFTPGLKLPVGKDEPRTVTVFICDLCGAAVVDDPQDDGQILDRHSLWHDHLRNR